MMQKRYIQEVIKQDFTTWNNEHVVISSGTNTGKTTFIINTLIPYAQEQGKRVLYLVNRKYLNEALRERIAQYPNATLRTYQSIEEMIRRRKAVDFYDFIVCDECHYFLVDSVYNRYTDLSLNWLMNQNNNVVVWMSATANMLYTQFYLSGSVKQERVYRITQEYDHVANIYFYYKNQLTNVIDDIIKNSDDEKIIVFVNAIDRLKEMHDYYKDTACYLCSKTREKDDSLSFVDFGCVQNNTFEKRILFCTKSLDNGIDLKDTKIKHVMSEIADVACAMQAIGRKRPIADDDNYNLYFRSYGNRGLTQFLKAMREQLTPVDQYMQDTAAFLDAHRYDRDLLARNKVMFVDFSDLQPQIRINNNIRKKFYMDMKTYERMIAEGYKETLLKFFESDVSGKVQELKINKRKTDLFLDYLRSIQGTKLFKPGQKELKEKFKTVGLHDRSMGINTLNGKLKDCEYKYKIVSAQETKGTNRNKRYWCVVPI